MKKSYVALIVSLALLGLFLAFLRPVQLSGNTLLMSIDDGESMTPAINVGDIIIMKVDADIEVGDVITFHEGSYFVTHRVIGLSPNGFITKGDANNDIDINPVYSKDIVGKVVLVVPYIGYIVHFARSFWGPVLLIYVPTGILIAISVVKLIKSIPSKAI